MKEAQKRKPRNQSLDKVKALAYLLCVLLRIGSITYSSYSSLAHALPDTGY